MNREEATSAPKEKRISKRLRARVRGGGG
jgi:hypothetical protein